MWPRGTASIRFGHLESNKNRRKVVGFWDLPRFFGWKLGGCKQKIWVSSWNLQTIMVYKDIWRTFGTILFWFSFVLEDLASSDRTGTTPHPFCRTFSATPSVATEWRPLGRWRFLMFFFVFSIERMVGTQIKLDCTIVIHSGPMEYPWISYIDVNTDPSYWCQLGLEGLLLVSFCDRVLKPLR